MASMIAGPFVALVLGCALLLLPQDFSSILAWILIFPSLAVLVIRLRLSLLDTTPPPESESTENSRFMALNELRVRSILNAAYDAFIAIDSDGHIIEWNLQAERSLGWKRGDVLGQSVVETIIPKRHRADHLRGFEKYKLYGIGPILNQRIEISAMHKHGYEIPVELVVTPVEIDGAPIFGAFLRDISERRLGEQIQALQLSVTRILNEVPNFSEAARRILEVICQVMVWDVGIFWTKDRQDQKLKLSSVWYPSSSITLRSFAESCRAMAFSKGEGLAGQVMASGEMVFSSSQNYRTAAAHRSELNGAIAFPVSLDGSIQGVLEFHSRALWEADEKIHGVMRDIAIQVGMYLERKKVEEELRRLHLDLERRVQERSLELKQKNEELSREIEEHKRTRADLEAQKNKAEAASNAKSAFLANMSHEIRTPLGAVIGFSELLQNPQLSDADRDAYQAIIKRNGDVVCRVINDILDLSRVESGKLSVEKVETSIPELLTDLSVFLNLLASEKGLRFSINYDGGLPDVVETDPQRLRQILVNVVGNAIKFTHKGFVELQVRMQSGPLGREHIVFVVRDSGRGISLEDQEKIFEPFTQADASSTRVFGGSGLGLPLSRRLAQLLGGNIEVNESQLNYGSTFTISIDPGITGHVRLQSRPTQKSGLHLVSEKVQLDGLKVLLVEDAPDIQMLVSRMLRLGGAICDVADNGEMGIERALRDDYDVLLVDLQMPVMDGYETVRELRARGYRRPVIALTAHALKEERIRCLDAGFDDHLTKPIDRAKLYERLARCKKKSCVGALPL